MQRKAGGRFVFFTLLWLAAGLASCSKSPTAPPADQSASAPPASSAAPAAATAAAPAAPVAGPMAATRVIASAQYSLDPNLRVDLLEVKRVSGGALLVRWRIVDTAGSQQNTGLIAGEESKRIRYGVGGTDSSWAWSELYFTDPAENKKYSFLMDSDGNRLLDVFTGDFHQGDQRENWAKFPAPPATSTKVTIYIPKFPPFEDVPVS